MAKKPSCAPRCWGSAPIYSEQGLRRGAEQNAIEDFLVVEGEFGDLLGQRENTQQAMFARQTSTGGPETNSSACLLSSHWARAKPWHLGQWRFRQEL